MKKEIDDDLPYVIEFIAVVNLPQYEDEGKDPLFGNCCIKEEFFSDLISDLRDYKLLTCGMDGLGGDIVEIGAGLSTGTLITVPRELYAVRVVEAEDFCDEVWHLLDEHDTPSIVFDAEAAAAGELDGDRLFSITKYDDDE